MLCPSTMELNLLGKVLMKWSKLRWPMIRKVGSRPSRHPSPSVLRTSSRTIRLAALSPLSSEVAYRPTRDHHISKSWKSRLSCPRWPTAKAFLNRLLTVWSHSASVLTLKHSGSTVSCQRLSQEHQASASTWVRSVLAPQFHKVVSSRTHAVIEWCKTKFRSLRENLKWTMK